MMRRIPRSRPSSRGFTLVEVLVALVILGVGLVSLIQLFIVAMWSYQKAHYLSIATQHAQYEFERVENFGCNVMKQTPANLLNSAIYDPNAGYTQHYTAGVADGIQIAENDLPSGRCTVIVSPFRSTANTNIIEVTISVTWTGITPTVSPVTIYTLLAK